MSGNICRCGAYPNIVAAVRAVAGSVRMKAFNYERATATEGAIHAGAARGAKFLAGGTNLVDLMKYGRGVADDIWSISTISTLKEIVARPDGGVKVGALVKNSDLANHPLIKSQYPLLSQALLSGASPQLRNMATTGGNLLQRTRCYYFYRYQLSGLQ